MICFFGPIELVLRTMQADLAAALGIAIQAIGVPSSQLAQPAFALEPLTTPISIEMVNEGTGQMAETGDRVTLHFVVRTQEGKELANTRKRGMPFTIELSEPGSFWSSAVDGMRVGGKNKLLANSSVFFGRSGVLPIIPAETWIEAELVLLKVQKSTTSRVASIPGKVIPPK